MHQDENSRDFTADSSAVDSRDEVNESEREEFTRESSSHEGDAEAGFDQANKHSESGERESTDMEVDVGTTVTRLEELDRLLKGLNFRELIMQFGRLQGDLELIRYELDNLTGESRNVNRQLGHQYFETELDDTVNSVSLVDTLTRKLSLLESEIRKLMTQNEILAKYARGSRGWLLERSGEVLGALNSIKETEATRIEMVDSLNAMLESDVPNDKLASAALEFAVFMKEINMGRDLETLEKTIDDISGFREEVETAEALILAEPVLQGTVEAGVAELTNVLDVARMLAAFYDSATATLTRISEGWNEEQNGVSPSAVKEEPIESNEE